jgi:tetratricopeptide (TPR) repeat protein
LIWSLALELKWQRRFCGFNRNDGENAMLEKGFWKILLVPFSVLVVSNLIAAQRKPIVAAKPAARLLIVKTEPNAAVWLNEIRRGTTDSTGVLKIEPVGAGAKRLRVRAVGFAEKTQIIPATSASGEIKIALMKITDKAEISFQQAEFLRESPKDPADRRKAVELYRQALKLRPRFAAAHTGLARVLADLNEIDEALEEVKAARRDSTNFAEASVVEGRIYRSESVADFDKAAKSFRRAIAESKDSLPEAHSGLALALRDKEDYAAAIAEFKIAIAKFADTEPILYQLLGETYEKAGNKKKAVAAYEKFVRLAPKSPAAVAVRSIIEQLKRQPNKDTLELLPQ